MNTPQRHVITLGIILAVGMLVFPPFHAQVSGSTRNLGYHFVAEPPSWGSVTGTVDTALLALQLAVLAGAIAGAWFLAGDKEQRSGKANAATTTDNTRPVDSLPIDQSKTFLGGHYHPWRRYFARFIDYQMIGVGLGAFAIAVSPEFAGYYEKADSGFWLVAGLLIVLIAVPIEATLISSTACTTPGKWLFGIRVAADDGQPLPFNRSLARAFTVWFQGVAAGVPILAALTMFFAYRRLTRTGSTAWDESTDAVVQHGPWSPAKALLAVAIIVALMLLASSNDRDRQAQSTEAQQSEPVSAVPAVDGIRHFAGEDRLLLGHPGTKRITFEEALVSGPALDAYKRGDFAAAAAMFLPEARKGSSVQEFYIAEMLLAGHGVVKDEANAFKWYLSSANHGYMVAATTVGVLYLRGVGVQQDIAQGAEWLRRAADDPYSASCGVAEYNLGVLNEADLFGNPDYASAYHWYQTSANKALLDTDRALATQGMARVAQFLPPPPPEKRARNLLPDMVPPPRQPEPRPCEFKPVMTDEDYRACGRRPPSSVSSPTR